jgi:uncharacterized membrane protein
MGKDISRARTMGEIGAILSLLYFVPMVGWVLALVGLVLLYMSVQDLVKASKHEGAEKRLLTAVILDVISWVVFAIALVVFFFTLASGNASGFGTFGPFMMRRSFGWREGWDFARVGMAGLLLLVPYVLNLISGFMYRDALNSVSEITGVSNFRSAGNLIMWGRILEIILVGFVVDFIGRVLMAASFFQLPDTLSLPTAQTTPPSE